MIIVSTNFAFLQQEGARCRKQFWFESERQYEVYWYGETWEEKKEAKQLEEKRKKEHRGSNKKVLRHGVLKRWRTEETLRTFMKIAKTNLFSCFIQKEALVSYV